MNKYLLLALCATLLQNFTLNSKKPLYSLKPQSAKQRLAAFAAAKAQRDAKRIGELPAFNTGPLPVLPDLDTMFPYIDLSQNNNGPRQPYNHLDTTILQRWRTILNNNPHALSE